VVHDVFLRLPALVRAYHSGDFGAWIARVVARAARSAARSRWRELPLLVEPSTDDDPIATETAEWSDRDRDDVQRALGELSTVDRHIVELRAAGCSHHEAAQRVGVSLTASQVRYCRALKQVRRALRRSTAPISS
jgi:RNA polymerase sigma factor (sigma-70 family)